MSSGSSQMFNSLANYKELSKRITFTLAIIVICRLGSYIPLPSINSYILAHIASENSKGILGMFNMLSGGSLARMSIFTLAIMPYITSSIVIQLLTVISKKLENLKKDGETGRKIINQYTRYATVFLASIQAYGIAVGLEKISYNSIALVENIGIVFKFTTIITLTSGTIFLMWLGEQISSRGIGNGTSLIIFAGIVAGIPSAFYKTFELSKTGAISYISLIFVITFSICILLIIIFVERAQRKVIVQYPKRQVGNKIYGGETSHIPLKLNTAGVIPPIFASSILLFPATLAKLPAFSSHVWIENLISYLDHGKPLYILLYFILIVFFSFFYTAIVFNPEETALNLKKYNGYIIGKKPGKDTSNFFDYTLSRITVLGSFYIAFICLSPEIIMANYRVPFYLSGTSILIVVNVIIDTVTQIQTYLFSNQYESLIKKSILKEKNK